MDYCWYSKDVQSRAKNPRSAWAGTAIREVLCSEYAAKSLPESLPRTICDILLCDRLKQLDHAKSSKHLSIVPEAKMEFSVTTGSIKKTVSGCRDWALSYMDDESRLHETFVFITATPPNAETALPQLLTYLVSVQAARFAAEKINKAVFGLSTDGALFQFAVLRETKKLFVSKPLDWWSEKAEVVKFLDYIL